MKMTDSVQDLPELPDASLWNIYVAVDSSLWLWAQLKLFSKWMCKSEEEELQKQV